MNFLSTLLDIVIFLLSLTVLIVIHEAGHLTAAKIFKVYCYEFSIGMGPLVYQHKPNKNKNQETAFSVRALPIGGYVSMAGEDLEDAEGVDKSIVVPKDRTIEAKSRWKRIIIMFAGVFMNFILGYLLLLFSFGALTQITQNPSSRAIEVTNDSLASKSGLVTGDEITHLKLEYYEILPSGQYEATPTHVIENDVTCYAFSETPADLTQLNSSVSVILSNTYYTDPTDASKVENYAEADKLSLNNKRVITLTYSREEVVQDPIVITTLAVENNGSLAYETIGITSRYLYLNYSFGEAVVMAWQQWCAYSVALINGVISLFNPASWGGLGGIISIFKITSQAASISLSRFVNMWALISINLGVMNLLPFPGLDGWQIIVTIFEGIFYSVRNLIRKIKYRNNKLSEEQKAALQLSDEKKSVKREATYKKVKNIMSGIGLVLLIGLSVLLIIKDIIAPAI